MNPGLTIADLGSASKPLSLTLPACPRFPAPQTIELNSQSIAEVAKAYQLSIDLDGLEKGAKSLQRLKPADRRLSNTELKNWANLSAAPAVTSSLNELKTDAAATTKKIVAMNLDLISDLHSDAELTKKVQGYYASVNALAILANNVMPDNQPIRPRRLPEQTTVVLPGADPRWSAVRIKPGLDPLLALNQVSLALATVGVPAEAPRLSKKAYLIGSVLSAEDCNTATPASDWPFSMNELIRVLARNRDFRKRVNLGPSKKITTILLADSGFDFGNGSTRAFGENYIQSLVGPRPRGGTTSASNPGLTVGVNLALNYDRTDVQSLAFPRPRCSARILSRRDRLLGLWEC